MMGLEIGRQVRGKETLSRILKTGATQADEWSGDWEAGKRGRVYCETLKESSGRHLSGQVARQQVECGKLARHMISQSSFSVENQQDI